MLTSIAKTINEHKEKFFELSIEDKCLVINEMLYLYQNNAQSSKLSLIGGPSKTSRIRIQKNLKDTDKMSIIHQSPSGIFEHGIELTSL